MTTPEEVAEKIAKIVAEALGRGLISSHPDSGRSECDGSQEVPREFVVSRGDPSEVFELAEEALDEIAVAIEAWIDRSLGLAVTLGRDVSLAAALADQIDQMLPVIAAIGDHHGGWMQTFEQSWCGSFVGCLPRRESETDRQSTLIDDNMDLAGQPSPRTADGVIRTPFLPPAACWWARTMDESINCIDCGEVAAKASKTRSHTPALAHRL